MASLMNCDLYNFIKNQFQVDYENEDGIDAGGLSREWIVIVLKEALDPQNGLFVTSSN